MPTYLLHLQHESGEREDRVWDSGGRRYYLWDVFELDGERWEVVRLQGRNLPGASEPGIVEDLTCAPTDRAPTPPRDEFV